ncbi:hypothetical protein QTP88_003864 [Uroleucon formosanum]
MLNGGEQIICGAKVDGFDENIYEYMIQYINIMVVSGMNVKNVSERSDLIKKAGYNLVEMWECKWIKSTDYKHSEKSEIIEPLNPRDAFFGGRTNTYKLWYYDYYPVGHSENIVKPKSYNKNWFGVIKCKILPPRNLYHPVLPVKVRMNKYEKLLFPLCLEYERMITGTWSTIKVNKAIEKSYKIQEIHEVWHFKNKSNKLFKGYVRYFMKIKLESNRHHYNSNEEYIQDIKIKLNIDLDPEKIEVNPARRAVAKTCLNRLWGKFEQRQNMTQTEYMSDVRRFYEILLDDRLTDINVNYLTDEMTQMTLFTTANARLRLYEQLGELGEAVIYCDTDSIVYFYDGKNTVKTGDMLGE